MADSDLRSGGHTATVMDTAQGCLTPEPEGERERETLPSSQGLDRTVVAHEHLTQDTRAEMRCWDSGSVENSHSAVTQVHI